MPKKESKTRAYLKEEFEKSLSEDTIPWHQPWVTHMRSKDVNHISQKQYNGINRMMLAYIGFKRQYKSREWLTFNQLKNKGYHFRKAEDGTSLAKGRGVPIELYKPYDLKNKKSITFPEFERIQKGEVEGMTKEDVTVFVNNYTVFNGDLIEEIYERGKNSDVGKTYNDDVLKNNDSNILVADKVLNNYAKAENVKIYHDVREDQAYFVPILREIHIPARERFTNDANYIATLSHEISHSTGDALKRENQNQFGTEKYAQEELVADISSAFLTADFGIKPDKFSTDNHKAYIQNWISKLENHPNELFSAISKAEKAANYVEEKGELEKVLEEVSKPQKEEAIPEKGPLSVENISLKVMEGVAFLEAHANDPEKIIEPEKTNEKKISGNKSHEHDFER